MLTGNPAMLRQSTREDEEQSVLELGLHSDTKGNLDRHTTHTNTLSLYREGALAIVSHSLRSFETSGLPLTN